MKILVFASALLLACAAMPTASPASTLSDLAAEAGVEWVIGSWISNEGDVKISYEWRLDKNAIAVKYSFSGREVEGMMALKPGSKKVHYMAVDNQGAVSKGEWSEYQGNPLLKSTSQSDEGEMKIATEHFKIDADRMGIKVYKQDDSGNPSEMIKELEFKRAK